MKDLGLVSIIIPVYNVEKYLPQCLDSVCKQTYTNLEIIVVDDESLDNCGKIADEYAEKDDRMKVLHIQNKGAAGARNRALDTCTGEYVMFVDSDDWLEDDAIEKMIVAITTADADIVQCQYMDEYTYGAQKHTYIEENHVGDKMLFVETMIRKWEYIINCNKIYRRKLVARLRFPEGRCIDDEFYTYRAVLKAEKIVCITDYLYHYRQRKNSAMGSKDKTKQRYRDQVDFITQRYKPLVQELPQLRAKLLEHMLEVLMSVMRNGTEYEGVYRYAKRKLYKYGVGALLRHDIHVITKKSILIYLIKSRRHFKPDVVGDLKQENYFE